MSSRLSTALPAFAAGTVSLGSELSVARMGFGAMQLPGPGVWGPPADRAEALAVVRRGVDLGVNLIDTAGFYGPAVADELIAEALHPFPEGIVLSTKVGVRRGEGEGHPPLPDAAPASLRDQVEGSLRRLRVDVLDLVYLRLGDGIALDDSHVPLADSFGALVELRREGLVRELGLSAATERALSEAKGIGPVVAVENRFNVLDRAEQPMLELCEEAEITFVPFFPLARGAVAESDAIAEVARAHHATPAQIALAWLLQVSPATLPIPGTSSRAHVEENVAAAAIRLDDDELGALSDLDPAGQPPERLAEAAPRPEAR